MSNQDGNFNVKSNGKLAEPPEGSGAQKLHEKVSQSMDRMTEHVLKELDELVAHIEEIKDRIQDHAAQVQVTVKELFSMSDQALAFKAQVKSWLDDSYGPQSDPSDRTPDTSDSRGGGRHVAPRATQVFGN